MNYPDGSDINEAPWNDRSKVNHYSEDEEIEETEPERPDTYDWVLDT